MPVKSTGRMSVMSLNDRVIDAAALVRLRQRAPGALARRDRHYFQPVWGRIIGIFLNLGLAIYGLRVQGWTPTQAALLFWLGLWGGVLADGLRLWLLAPWVRRTVAGFNDDRWVFELVACLRAGQTGYRSDLTAQYRPKVGFAIDLVILSMVSLMFLLASVNLAIPVLPPIESEARQASWSFALALLWPLLMALVQVISVRADRKAETAVMVSSGERGLGAFVLMLAMAVLSEFLELDPARLPFAFLLPAYVGSLAVAAMLLFAIWRGHQDRTWLIRWLGQSDSNQTA